MCFCHPVGTWVARYQTYKLRQQDRARERAAAEFKAEEQAAMEEKEMEEATLALQAEKKTAEATATFAASTMTADSAAATLSDRADNSQEQEIDKER
jgi:hypothetical protein